MKSLLVALMLLLHIAYGLCEESVFTQDDGSYTSNLNVREIIQKGCHGGGECIRKLCSLTGEMCQKREDYSQITCKCRDFLPNSIDGSYKNTRDLTDKRSVMDKSSYLLMKLHPLLNRGVDPTSMKVQNRYRRLGVRLGSEFLGKRNTIDKETEPWNIDDLEPTDGFVRKRAPGTELLGKRWGSEMLGKRNVEMLGKRGGEFLGKRGGEFLGKRGGEFLGKRGTEFLGKRGYDLSDENGLMPWLSTGLEDGPARRLSYPKPLLKLFEFIKGVNAENDTINIRSAN